jgi:SAM-dependent methyltransferase
VSTIDKFDRLARGYAEHDYADPARYTARRAAVAVGLGPPLQPGATVLDLACGDANMAEPLQALGLAYRGVDGSPEMIAEARARLGEDTPLEVGLIGDYEPPRPVDMTLCLRAVLYLADDRVAFFRRVRSYTRVKFVFDFDPRVQAREPILEDLREAGFGRAELRPFFLPQRLAVPAPARGALRALEHGGPLARAALRLRGIWFCAAYGR